MSATAQQERVSATVQQERVSATAKQERVSATIGAPVGTRDRIAALDVLRGVAIVAVVMRHVSWRMLTPSSVHAPGGGVIAAVFLASDCGVSLFVAAAALALALHHPQPFGGVRAYARFVSLRARRLLPAYVLWSLLSLAARDLALLSSPRGIGEALLYGTADVQFYFVPLVFELYLLWPVLRPLLVRRTAWGAALVLAAGAAAADLAWRGIVPPLWTSLPFFATSVAAGAAFPAFAVATGARGNDPFAKTLSPASIALAVLLGFAATSMLAYSTIRFVDAASLCDSRVALYALTMFFAREHALFALASAAALAVVAGAVASTRVGAGLASLGRNSYGIFLVHLLVASTLVYHVVGVEVFAGNGGLAAASGLVGVCVVTVATSYGVTRMLVRWPRLRWIVGAA